MMFRRARVAEALVLSLALLPLLAGCTDKDKTPNEAPTAAFTYRPLSPIPGDAVRFTDSSKDADGKIEKWRWNFGDGSTATSREPTHRFSAAGIFNVTLIVEDGDRAKSASSARSIEVFAVRPLSIQALVDAAPPGAEVRVPAGRYVESVSVDKPLTLVADGTVEVDGKPFPAFKLSRAAVRLEGFRVASEAHAIEMTASPSIDLVDVTAPPGQGLLARDVGWVRRFVAPEGESAAPALRLQNSSAMHANWAKLKVVGGDGAPLAGAPVEVTDGGAVSFSGTTDGSGTLDRVPVPHAHESPSGNGTNTSVARVGGQEFSLDPHRGATVLQITPASGSDQAQPGQEQQAGQDTGAGSGPSGEDGGSANGQQPADQPPGGGQPSANGPSAGGSDPLARQEGGDAAPTFLNIPPEAVPAAVAGTAAAASAAGVGAAFALHDGFRWRWLAMLAPLYTRLARSEVLDHDSRHTIYGHIAAHPGAHLRQIKRELGVAHGTLLHHLQMLESQEYVRSVRDGMYRRYYTTGTVLPAATEDLGDRVLGHIRANPGTRNADICAALRKSPSLVAYHVSRLEQEGKLRRERIGREARLYLTEPLTTGTEPAPAEAGP